MTDEEIPEEFATLFVTNLPDDEVNFVLTLLQFLRNLLLDREWGVFELQDAIRSEFSKYGEVSSIRLLPRKEDQDTRAG